MSISSKYISLISSYTWNEEEDTYSQAPFFIMAQQLESESDFMKDKTVI